MTAILDRSSKIQILSHAALIAIFIFIITTLVIPQINANSADIKKIEEDIQKVEQNIIEFGMENVLKKLEKMDDKLNKIVLGMCDKFGGKYCE